MIFKSLVIAALLALPLAAISQAADAGPYKVQKIQLVGGDGGFDYVTADSDGRNLYVARSGPAGHIGVFNLDTLAAVGDIPNVSSHGAAVDTATGHGFATSKPVVMFDAKTFAVLKKIDVQGNPDGYLNDPFNHHFYILSHAEPNITVLDDKDGSILGTINIGGAPEQAVTDGAGKMYVDIEDKDAIAVIDAASMKMTGKYRRLEQGRRLCGAGYGCEESHPVRRLPGQEEHDHSFRDRRQNPDRSADRQRVGWSDVQSGDDGGVQLAGGRNADGDQGEFTDGLCGGADGADAGASQDADAGHEDQPDLHDHGRVWAGACWFADSAGTFSHGGSACWGSAASALSRGCSKWRSAGVDARTATADDPAIVSDPGNWEIAACAS